MPLTVVSNLHMWRRVPWKVWIGIGLILLGAGLFGGWRWWMETRTWVPLEIPISLAKGHIRSPEFKINFEGTFWIWVEFETEVDGQAVTCWIGYDSEYCRKNNIHEMRASWKLSGSGKIHALGDASQYRGPYYPVPYRARGLGNFKTPSGQHYLIDLDVPEDFSRFDAFHPKLAIVTSDYWIFENWQVWVALLSSLLVAIGLAIVLHTIGTWLQRKRDYRTFSLTVTGPLTRTFMVETGTSAPEDLEPKGTRLGQWFWVALTAAVGGICGYTDVSLQWMAALGIVGASLFALGWAVRFAPRSKPVTLGISPNHSQNIQWAQRLPLRRPIAGLPGFGLFNGTVFAILAILMMMLTFGFQVTSTGEWVHLLKPGQILPKPDSWTEPLIVLLKDEGVGQEPKLFVNSKETTWDGLGPTLKQELATRKEWLVYVGGDDAIPYVNVAFVIDTARGLGAKVVLITSKK